MRSSPGYDPTRPLNSPVPELRLRDERAVDMSLLWEPRSPSAASAIERIYHLADGDSSTVRERNLKAALGAIIYDLLTSADGSTRPCFRPMSAGSFTGQAIGYRAATAAIDLLLSRNLIRRAGGNFDRTLPVHCGTVTRLWPTDELLAILAGFGILPAARQEHFQRIQSSAGPSKLIYLNATSTRVRTR